MTKAEMQKRIEELEAEVEELEAEVDRFKSGEETAWGILEAGVRDELAKFTFPEEDRADLYTAYDRAMIARANG